MCAYLRARTRTRQQEQQLEQATTGFGSCPSVCLSFPLARLPESVARTCPGIAGAGVS